MHSFGIRVVRSPIKAAAEGTHEQPDILKRKKKTPDKYGKPSVSNQGLTASPI